MKNGAKDEARRPKGSGCVIKRQRKSGTVYYCRWRADGQEFTRQVKSEHLAKRILGRVEDFVEDGMDLEAAIRAALGEPEPLPDETTFGELATRYIEALERDGKRTVQNIVRERSRANCILKAPIAALHPLDIAREDVARWTEWLRRERGQGGTSVNRSLSLGSSVWKWAQDFALAPNDRNPFLAGRLRSREISRDKGETWTPEEVGVLARLAPLDLRRLIVGAINTGMRPGELQSLEWRDIHDLDSKAPFIRIRATTEKGRRGRVVPATPELARLLRRPRESKVKPHPHARVFVRDDGRPWTNGMRRHYWERLRDRCLEEKALAPERIEDRWFYDLRAAAITTMLAAGIAPVVVMRLVGHRHLSTTMRYTGTLSSEQKAAQAKMARALRTGTG